MCYSIEQVKIKIEKMIQRGYIGQEAFDKMPDNWVLKAFLHPKVKVISNTEPFVAKGFTWGLIPKWANIDNAFEIQKRTLNAVSETITEKASYKHLVGQKHCLIPVSGFYEWRTFNKSKYPHYIYMKSQEPFMLAGLWDSWVNPETAETHNSFTILTCEANELMKKIHNTKQRMPVIIDVENEHKWLKAKTYDEAIELCQPYDETRMEAHSIDKKIIMDKFMFNSPKVNKHVEYAELNQQSLFD